MLLEYKLFEPAFYTTDVPDWGTAYAHCLNLGPKAQVVVDTGHHAPGTNIEFIVALLLREGKLGGFDFNSRFYADDDLMVGAADPFQLFRIMHEVVKNGGFAPETGVAFMLDQCHNIEAKIPAIIRSVMNVQEATAKALLVDGAALAAAQHRGDVLEANAVLMDAYNTDVRPLLAEVREEMGLDAGPGGRLPGHRLGGADRRGAGRRRHRPAGAPDPSPRCPGPSFDAARPSTSAAPLPPVPQRTSASWLPSPASRRRRAAGALAPAGRRPAQHQLRGRQHLRQGHRAPTPSPAPTPS